MAKNKEKQAQKMFAKLTKMLDKRDWSYSKNESKLMIMSGVQDDLPLQFVMLMDVERELIFFRSDLPFSMPEDKLIEGALAICAINCNMVQGSFGYDVTSGAIHFRHTFSYKDGSDLSDDALEAMIYVAAGTVAEYNDKLEKLAKGEISFKSFLS